MTDERSESAPSVRVKQVISYRVAVKRLAILVHKLACDGTLSDDELRELREMSRGR